MAVVVAIVMVMFLKPLLTLAAGFMICSSCDSASALFLSAIVIFGAMGIAFYKLFKVFYGTGPV